MIWRLRVPPRPSVHATPLLNFCNGFAQGVVQTERLNSEGSKICLPTPAPKRSETMKQLVTWVMADTARKERVRVRASSASCRNAIPATRGSITLAMDSVPQPEMACAEGHHLPPF